MKEDLTEFYRDEARIFKRMGSIFLFASVLLNLWMFSLGTPPPPLRTLWIYFYRVFIVVVPLIFLYISYYMKGEANKKEVSSI